MTKPFRLTITILTLVFFFLSFPKSVKAEVNCTQRSTSDIAHILPQVSISKQSLSEWAHALAHSNRSDPITHHVEECYEDVIYRAYEAGVDPNIALTLWYQESAASDYETFGSDLQDFGINTPSIASNFDAQIEGLLKRPELYLQMCECADMNSFVSLYRSGNDCQPTEGDSKYLEKTLKNLRNLSGDSNAQLPLYPAPSLYNQCNGSESIQFYPEELTGGSTESSSTLSTTTSSPLPKPPPHPLRPNPFEGRSVDDNFLTPYCAYRPTAVKDHTFNIFDYTITPFDGQLTTSFYNFITPFLSISDKNQTAYQSLDSTEKSQYYLADYLDGRAFYEGFAEPHPNHPITSKSFKEIEEMGLLTSEQLSIVQSTSNLSSLPTNIKTIIQDSFLPSRVGVFRRLAPSTYQDELKHVLIQRALGQFDSSNNPYGAPVSSEVVSDYAVGCWDGVNVVDFSNYPQCSSGSLARLSSFQGNEIPLPTNPKYKDNQEVYYQDLKLWRLKDGGKWYQLWPYVPMFSREDTIGTISIMAEPGQDPNKKSVDVTHPQLARTYEVATTLSSLLIPHQDNPYNYHQDNQLYTPWITPDPWDQDIYWLDSGQNTPSNFGPVCQPLNHFLASSGDMAQESSIDTTVFKQTINPVYDGSETTDACGTHPTCAECITKELPNGSYYKALDYGSCKITKTFRFSPIYLKTNTPFLDAISNSLVTGPNAIFNIFFTHQEQQTKEPQDWPAIGIGSPSNPVPEYDYLPDRAESGFKNPGQPANFLYKSLGWIHCQKHDLFNALLPHNFQLPAIDECTDTFDSNLGPGGGKDGQGVDGDWLELLAGLAHKCTESGADITDQIAARTGRTTVQLLPTTVSARSEDQGFCITPTMIVVHWSGGWENASGNNATWNTLVARNLACQIASDTDDNMLMQPFYEQGVEMAWCSGEWNIYSINNEISGGYVSSDGTIDLRFTDAQGNPTRSDGQVHPTDDIIQNAVNVTCTAMKQYHIPASQVRGHYEVPNNGGKSDPGEEFLQKVFIPKIKEQCGNIQGHPNQAQ